MSIQEVEASLPLAVDLDGTLLKTDVLFEGLAAALTRAPWIVLLAPFIALVFGRPMLKRLVARHAPLDPALLPYRNDVLAWLRSEHAAGRSLCLATAAARTPAEAVAAHLGLFSRVFASEGRTNLKAARKAEALAAAYPQGFVYAADSGADVKVWSRARGAVLVDASPGVAARARAAAPVEREFPRDSAPLALWLRALRAPHWLKNLLVFAAIPAAHVYDDPNAWVMAGAGFVILCLIVSATYLINDLVDLPADRAHPVKRHRPFAAGDLPIAAALVAAPLGIALGLGAAFALESGFGWLAALYVGVTLAYSLGLKRAAFVDVLTIGALFTLRVVIGAVLIGVVVSPYLFLFSMFLFTALALAKRYAEATAKAEAGIADIAGRGYRASDAPLIFTAGAVSALGAVIVLFLYVTDAGSTEPFAEPLWLWALPSLVGAWLVRIWLKARAGTLTEDPLLFAVRDRWSLALGAAVLAAYVLAAP